VRVLWGIDLCQNNTIIYGRHGTVAVSDMGYPSLVVQSNLRAVAGAGNLTWRGVQGCYAPKLPAATPETDIVGHFVNALRTGKAPSCSGSFQLHVHEILFGAYESATTGTVYRMTTPLDSWNKLPGEFYDTTSGFI